MPPGRKKIEFDQDDWDKIEKMAQILCTGKEIANVMGVSYDTLERRVIEHYGVKKFADWINEYASYGKMSLRRLQFESAKKLNPLMLIWLGKQYLGQSDKNNLQISQAGQTLIDIVDEIHKEKLEKEKEIILIEKKSDDPVK